MAKKIGKKEAELRAMREKSTAVIQLDRTAIAAKRKAAQEQANKLFADLMERETKPIDAQIEKLDTERTELDARLSEIELELTGLRKTRAEIMGEEVKPRATGKGGGGAGSRFPSSDLPKVAESIAAFIIAAKSDGVSGGDIRAHVGSKFTKPNGAPYTLLPSVKIVEFLKEHKADINATKTGNKASTRYFDHDAK